MNTWFECKVTYDRTGEDGIIKKVTEPYLVDALSFTEAETRINKECAAYATGEFTVSAVKRCKIAEMVYDPEGDRWYRCKVNTLVLDEEKGIEKRIPSTVMVQATTLAKAVATLTKNMDTMLSDYEIVTVTQTAILDVFQYQPPTE